MSGSNWNPAYKKRREVSANATALAQNIATHFHFEKALDEISRNAQERLQEIKAIAAERYGKSCSHCNLYLSTKTEARHHWADYPACKMALLHEQ